MGLESSKPISRQNTQTILYIQTLPIILKYSPNSFNLIKTCKKINEDAPKYRINLMTDVSRLNSKIFMRYKFSKLKINTHFKLQSMNLCNDDLQYLSGLHELSITHTYSICEP